MPLAQWSEAEKAKRFHSIDQGQGRFQEYHRESTEVICLEWKPFSQFSHSVNWWLKVLATRVYNWMAISSYKTWQSGLGYKCLIKLIQLLKRASFNKRREQIRWTQKQISKARKHDNSSTNTHTQMPTIAQWHTHRHRVIPFWSIGSSNLCSLVVQIKTSSVTEKCHACLSWSIIVL